MLTDEKKDEKVDVTNGTSRRRNHLPEQ
jgi:hypothetical protein